MHSTEKNEPLLTVAHKNGIIYIPMSADKSTYRQTEFLNEQTHTPTADAGKRGTDMMHTHHNHTDRRVGRGGRVLSAAMALLLLSGCFLTACSPSGAPSDTESDTGAVVDTVIDTSVDTESGVSSGTNADTTDTDGAIEPDSTTSESEIPPETETDGESEKGTTEPDDPPVVTLPPESATESAESDTVPEDITLAPVITETETLTPPEDITLPPVVTETEPADSDAETLPYDPELHPGDSEVFAGVMISAVHGTGKKGAEAVIDHGFIQLYNNTTKAISLKGASLYYKTEGANPYEQFVFPDDASVPAGGEYLIRTAAPSDVVESNLIMRISKFDIEWDTHIDNKEIRLLLAPSGWSVGRDEDITCFDDAISVFVASVAPHKSVFAVDDLSRNKIAVRTAKKGYSGYHLVNLTRSTFSDLQSLCPKTSRGEANEVVASRLNEVTFSHTAGVYTSTFRLTLSAPEGYTVYYTTDGSDPETSSSGRRYAGPIFMADTSSVQQGPMTQAWRPTGARMIGGKVVKAYATNGKDKTPVYTNTYFVTDDLTAYGVTVMSISIPKEEMIVSNYEGFYSGYCPPGTPLTADRPRGTGILEVFDAEGNRVGNSRVEMAVSGNGSSGAGMKSLRIYFKSKLQYNQGVDADPAYPAYESAGTQSALNYDLFEGRATNADGEVITSFSRLLLRNSGNDVGQSYIRDAYMQRVCAGLNVDTMASASMLMFVNGEFWGVYNARERYSPEYVESHYGVQKENVAVIESDYSQVHTNQNADFVLSSGLPGDEKDFNELIAYMRQREGGLSDADFAYICTRMDVPSFLDMWVTRLFFNARDWPENNIKVWRNRNPDDPSGFDTKWHFTLLDMDMGFSFFPVHDGNNTSENANFFGFFYSSSVTGMMMRTLMSNPGCREQFMLRYYDVVKNHLNALYLSVELEALIAERNPLMPLQVSRWSSDGASLATWESDCADMRSFVVNRTPYALQYFYRHFGVTEDQLEGMGEKRVTLNFHSGRANVILNGEPAESGTIVKFEKGSMATISVKATAHEGYTVTEIVYTDRNGNKQTIEGTEAVFRVTESGSISVMVRREGATGEQFGKGQLVAGATYLYYLSPDGDLYAWGDNRHGVLGLGTAGGTVNVPTFVMSGVVKVVTSAGNAYENGDTTFATAILTADGRVLTVGANTAGQLGRNGTGNSSQLGEIEFDGKVTDISMGHDHLLIMDDKSNLWGIGANNYGALGSAGVGGNLTAFTKIASNVETMSAGRRSTVYLTQDGRLWGLGDNRWKKLSQNHGEQIHNPVVIAENIRFIDSGEHEILAIDGNGKLYYAGWRTVQGFNQGAGNQPTMAEITLGADVKEADIYHANMVILTENGDAFVYGLNVDGGIGESVTNGTPKQVLSGISDIAAGYGFTAYLTADGRIIIQGNNAFGQAGNGSTGGVVSFGEADF